MTPEAGLLPDRELSGQKSGCRRAFKDRGPSTRRMVGGQFASYSASRSRRGSTKLRVINVPCDLHDIVIRAFVKRGTRKRGSAFRPVSGIPIIPLTPPMWRPPVWHPREPKER